MMMATASVFAEFRFLIPHGFPWRFARSFCHGIVLNLWTV
jgi:hypothetical protein